MFALAGCSRRAATAFYPAGPVRVSSPLEADKSCVERLLFRSRFTGYIEQTVDKEMAFFRVHARNQQFVPEVDKKGRPRPLKLPPGRYPAFVQYYNVQCLTADTAMITPMNSTGPLDERYVMDAAQLSELQRYANAIGVLLAPGATMGPSAPPPPPPLAP